jgi:transposase InsO family protein
VKYAFIQKHQKTWPVGVLCRVLEVARSGFYAWKHNHPSARTLWLRERLCALRRIHIESRRTYGSPRMHRELLAQGLCCCVNTVAKLMKISGIAAKTKRRFVVRTTDSNHDQPIAANVLDRQFNPQAPDVAWAGDITYVPTGEGWLFVAVVLDLFSRRVIGWASSSGLQATLAIEALQRAIESRLPGGRLVAHSDRGVQYASAAYRQLLRAHGLTASMSRRGNCYDNAVAESFHKTLKTELVYHEKYATRQEARSSIFEYIELFYNRQRRHSSLGYMSPVAFEAKHA